MRAAGVGWPAVAANCSATTVKEAAASLLLPCTGDNCSTKPAAVPAEVSAPLVSRGTLVGEETLMESKATD